MGQALAVALGGACGALMRYWMVVSINHALGRDFPYSTLTVNVLGAFLLGVVHTLTDRGLELSQEVRMGILMGGLGAFTTFSAFSFETLGLLDQGRFIAASLNVVLNVVLCVSACWLGFALGRSG